MQQPVLIDHVVDSPVVDLLAFDAGDRTRVITRQAVVRVVVLGVQPPVVRAAHLPQVVRDVDVDVLV